MQRRFALTLACLSVTLPSALAQSTPQPRFTSQSNLVLVPALVRDKAGEPVLIRTSPSPRAAATGRPLLR